MSALPSGTVTFVFSDIEGSTSLLKALGDRYGEVLDDHRSIMREQFTALGGVEIDTQGDAFFFAFSRARDAVAAAVEAQRGHATHAWPEGRSVRVRMGLHTGEPAVGSEGYLGIDVVRAARLCTVGRGGQVLLSETTRALVGGALPDGVAVHGLGERHLKDIDEPERVFELDIANAPTPAAPEAEPATEPADSPVPASAPLSPEADAAMTLKEQFKRELVNKAKDKNKNKDKHKDKRDKGGDDFGSRLSRRIEAYVQRRIEEPLERMLSEVDIIVERTAKDPDVISEKLEQD